MSCRTRSAILSVLALALVGCGSGGGTAESAFAEAAAATRSVDTMRYTMTGTVSTAGQSATYKGEGAADNSAGRATLSMTLPNPAGGEQIGMRAVMDGTKMYMQAPFLQELFAPGSKPWIEFDLQELGDEAGIDLGALFELGRQSDPLQLLTLLRAAGSVEEVGTEQVRGVETTRFGSDLDFSRYAEILEEDNPRAAKAIRALVDESGGELIVPMEVWIDGDDLVRRQSYEQSLPDGSSTKTTMEFYDFGADVDVELPPANEVTSLTDLLKEGGG